jgi:hypothetical protein
LGLASWHGFADFPEFFFVVVTEDEDLTTAIHEADELICEDGGLTIFEAGSYSQGPMQIGSEGEDEETFFGLEQCVNW